MKPLLTTALKCILLLSLSACNSFFNFSRSSHDSQKVDEAIWSATIIENGTKHNLGALTLNFSPSGKVVAKCSTCDVKGYWFEDERSDKFVMSFEPHEGLCELNKSWDVQVSSSAQVVLKSNDGGELTTLTLHIP